MKKFYLTIIGLISLSCFAQQQKNVADLDFLYKAIRQTPSYKDQLKHDESYVALYDSLKSDFKDTAELAVYKKLYRLIAPIKDNHLGFYKLLDSGAKARPLILELDVDSLKNNLKTEPLNSLSGLYKVDGHEFAVFSSVSTDYYVLHLKSRTVVGFIIKTPHHSLDFISLTGGIKAITLVRNVKHINGNYSTINLYKTAKPIFGDLPIGEDKFEFKRLNVDVGYLRLSSFYSSNSNIATAKEFFEQVKDSLTTPSLLVDVRNNSGGGFKVSQQFINFLKKYKGNIYILQNARTASHGEKFIIRLKDKENVITLGEPTTGTLAYGSNYGKTLTLPHHNFKFYPTDLKADKTDLPYESVGVTPRVLLDHFTEDWISQTLK